MQALHAAAQGLHAPQALHAAKAGVAAPMAAATANGSTVVDNRRVRVDFMDRLPPSEIIVSQMPWRHEVSGQSGRVNKLQPITFACGPGAARRAGARLPAYG